MRRWLPRNFRLHRFAFLPPVVFLRLRGHLSEGVHSASELSALLGIAIGGRDPALLCFEVDPDVPMALVRHHRWGPALPCAASITRHKPPGDPPVRYFAIDRNLVPGDIITVLAKTAPRMVSFLPSFLPF